MSSLARRLSSVERSPLAPSATVTASASTSQSASACSCRSSDSSDGRPPMSCVLAISDVRASLVGERLSEVRNRQTERRDGYYAGGCQQQHHAKRRAQATAPADVFLERHDRAQAE